MSDLDDALAAYHQACVILRDTHLSAGETRRAVTKQRADMINNAYASGTAITAARELADAGVAYLQSDLHVLESEINAQLATLRWLDKLIDDLHRSEVRDLFHTQAPTEDLS